MVGVGEQVQVLQLDAMHPQGPVILNLGHTAGQLDKASQPEAGCAFDCEAAQDVGSVQQAEVGVWALGTIVSNNKTLTSWWWCWWWCPSAFHRTKASIYLYRLDWMVAIKLHLHIL